MNNKFDFNDLFIFEMANNHQGNLEHGLKIIREFSDVANLYNIKAAIKLQLRDLDTFIHPNFKNDNSNKHITRFLSTKLTSLEFQTLCSEIEKNKMITMCTPFDENSVDRLMDLDIEVLKIGSCSASDWPLLTKIAETGKPVICSTGGLNLKQIDNVVSFFQHRGVYFALMHCVSIYPTPLEKLELNQIAIMRDRYPNVTIGFSTHEEPENLIAIGIAYAKGARIFERHVGIETEKLKLNSYSSTTQQIAQWLQAYQNSVIACGAQSRPPVDHSEETALESLMRGVYAAHKIEKGSIIEKSSVFFAMPLQPEQLRSGEWKEDCVSDRDYEKNEAISDKLANRAPSKKEIIYQTIHEIKGMINNARVVVGNDFSVEFSHQYGIEKFREIGAVIIDVINRAYCKKLIIQLPNQQHPYHYHKKKEETFQVLWGVLETEMEGNRKTLYPGDTLIVQQGVWHKFWTNSGVIFEEVSTTHFNDDSFYEDKSINRLTREQRKTKLTNWGVHQFD
ncbi:MAG: N-acetylneuraminate synthase family protein [Bacteroidetes bacterium]|nr:N-acetylneuraminate synthase family protein [Bacteroidota bacterium]